MRVVFCQIYFYSVRLDMNWLTLNLTQIHRKMLFIIEIQLDLTSQTTWLSLNQINQKIKGNT